MLTYDQFMTKIAAVEQVYDRQPEDKQAELNESLSIDFEEWHSFTKLKNEAMIAEIIDEETATYIYRALTEAHNPRRNGGWAKHINAATKYVITKMMAEILKAKLGIKDHSVKVG